MLPEPSTVLLFLAVTTVLFLIPGPSVLYIMTRSITQGRRAGLVSVLGMHAGTLPYVLITSLGLAALVSSSSTAFHVIRYLGAAYLIWLGIQKLWPRRAATADDAEPPPMSLRRIFVQAMVVSALNPKTLLFYTALLPQFVDPALGSVVFQILFFCAGFLVLGILSDGAYALLSSALADRLRGDRRRRLERSSGVVYLVLGAFAALVTQ